MKNAKGVAQDRRNDMQKLVSLHVCPFLNRAYREMLDAPVILVSLVTVVGASLVYSVTGPLGGDDTFSSAQRLLFVGLSTLLAWPFCHAFSALILYFNRRRKPYAIWLASAAAVPFMAFPCSAVAYTVFELFGRDATGRFRDIYSNVTVWMAACSCVIHYAACLRAKLRFAAESAGAEVNTGSELPPSAETRDKTHAHHESGTSRRRDRHGPRGTDNTRHEPSTATSRVATGRPARFLERLPRKLGRDVIYLNVSGHYVNAVTSEGSGVILMRFADAVAELGDMGMQVHRSYWVAHRHVTGVFRRDERTMVRVTGGHELPVSRTYLTAVRALIPQVAKGSDSDGS